MIIAPLEQREWISGRVLVLHTEGLGVQLPALQKVNLKVPVHTPVVPAQERLVREGHKSKAGLGYIVRPCLKTKGKKKLVNSYV